jgi:hypothetical protein
MALLLLRTATPPHVFDEAIYHLPVTRDFVAQGRIFPNFNNSMGNQPFLIHMIYALCLMAGSDIAAKFFSLALSIATALALYGFCERYVTRRVAAIAVFVFFAAVMVVEVSVTTRVDVAVAGMLFVTTYAMINYLQTAERGWLWTSALLTGFSLGVKHSAALWLLLIGAMYLIVSRRLRAKTAVAGPNLGSLERLEPLTFVAVTLGFALFTVGLVTGLARLREHPTPPAKLMLAISVVTPALQDSSLGLETGLSGLQWVIDAYTLPLAAVVLTAGAIADRFGRKRLFLQGMVVFTASSALCPYSASAPRFQSLIVPFRSVAMIASCECSTIADSRRMRASACLSAPMLMMLITTPVHSSCCM